MSNHYASAFPIQASDLPGSFNPAPGLTKRELFAAMAMQGMMPSIEVNDSSLTPANLAAAVAPICVAWADALLAELEKPMRSST